MNDAAPAADPAPRTLPFFSDVLVRTRIDMCRDGWQVVGVRPHGVVLERRLFGKTLRRLVCADGAR